jgi:hypothetical protein
MSNKNKLDFIQGVNLQPWEWHNLGAVFGSSKENNQCVAARCQFVVRKGFDEVEQTQYGNVLEGLGDVGFNLRAKQYAFHVSASNLSYKQGEQQSGWCIGRCKAVGALAGAFRWHLLMLLQAPGAFILLQLAATRAVAV